MKAPALRSSLPRTTNVWLAAVVIAQSLLITPRAEAADASDADKVKTGLQKILTDTKKATYSQRTWEKKGKDESSFRADCFWMGQTTIRMDIVEGDGKGGVAILKNGKVTGFLKGILSFAKMTYDPKDKAVLGLRGNGMPEAGFMDDLKLILRGWDNGKVSISGDKAVIDYIGSDKLPSKMWVKSDGSMVIKTEVYENGAAVGRSEFSRVNFAAKFDEKQVFNP